MPQMREITEEQLKSLRPEEMAALAQQMLRRLLEQDAALAQCERQIAQRDEHLQRKEHELRHKDANLEKLTFEVARFKRWKFGAKTEAMCAEQRRGFEQM